MGDLLARSVENLADRIGGHLSFRFVLQPLVAIVLAIRAGLQDARTGRPPYLSTILTNPAERGNLLREGWNAVAMVFVMAVAIDAVYQVIVLRWIYPGELLLVAFFLACVPYLLFRGPANRIAALLIGSPGSGIGRTRRPERRP